MYFRYQFTNVSEKQLDNIIQRDRYRILKRVEFYISTGFPLKFAEPLKNNPYGDFRFRIGNYRAIFDIEQIDSEETVLVITKIGNRKDVYD